jgi:DNA-binding transcriptional MocR family regulator
VWVEFPKTVSASELKKRAEEHKFTFLSGGDWYPNADPKDNDNTARFSFTTQPVEIIREGIELIGKLACEMAAE